MMTRGNWLKRVVMLAMSGMLDGSFLYGATSGHFRKSVLSEDVFRKLTLAELMDNFFRYIGVLLLLGYTVFVLCYFGFQR